MNHRGRIRRRRKEKRRREERSDWRRRREKRKGFCVLSSTRSELACPKMPPKLLRIKRGTPISVD